MLEKHKLFGDELLIHTPVMLRNRWQLTLNYYKDFLENNYKPEAFVELVEYILTQDYADKLYPGTSVGNLLISKPIDGKLNFQKTLKISDRHYDNKLELRYSDLDLIDNRDDYENAILWKVDCYEYQLIKKFKEFISWKKDW